MTLTQNSIEISKVATNIKMLFDVEKCKVMHIGYNNSWASYMMNGTVLQDLKEEQDLGVVIRDNSKCAKQCVKVVTKANRTLAMIKRNFSNFSDEVILRLYKSLVRPQLEYVVQAWGPYLKKDIELIEGIQRRATNLVHHLRGFQYEDRLRALHLTTLETRRRRGDLIEVFKIFKGLDKLESERFFTVSTSGTRGHELKLIKPRCRINYTKFAFSHRVADIWNA
jgi:ribonucleases P/MRP protein subunit RPP40